jgi:hypothetical protein
LKVRLRQRGRWTRVSILHVIIWCELQCFLTSLIAYRIPYISEKVGFSTFLHFLGKSQQFWKRFVLPIFLPEREQTVLSKSLSEIEKQSIIEIGINLEKLEWIIFEIIGRFHCLLSKSRAYKKKGSEVGR